MNKLILIVIILFLLFFLFKPNKDYQPNQEQIQDLSYIDKKQYINNFPYPQISNTFKRLSKGKLPEPLNNESQILPSGERNLKIQRTIQTPETIVARSDWIRVMCFQRKIRNFSEITIKK